MPPKFCTLFPSIQQQIALTMRKGDPDDELIPLPSPYAAQFPAGRSFGYRHAPLVSPGLLRLREIVPAKQQLENAAFLSRKRGFIPIDNRKASLQVPELPLLPRMLREVYRATGDEERLTRLLPDAAAEFARMTHIFEQMNGISNASDCDGSHSSPRSNSGRLHRFHKRMRFCITFSCMNEHGGKNHRHGRTHRSW